MNDAVGSKTDLSSPGGSLGSRFAPLSVLSCPFNVVTPVRRAERVEGESAFQEWFGGNLCITITEDVIGLGSYGKTLTVLHGIELQEDVDDADDDDEKIAESWTPRFRR